MTPDPKSPQFIRHDIPEDAPMYLVDFYEDHFLFLQEIARQCEWDGITPDNFVFEYSTYDGSAEIIFNYIDKNEHSHRVTVGYYGDDVSHTCWFKYRFTAENFKEDTRFVQSYAES